MAVEAARHRGPRASRAEMRQAPGRVNNIIISGIKVDLLGFRISLDTSIYMRQSHLILIAWQPKISKLRKSYAMVKVNDVDMLLKIQTISFETRPLNTYWLYALWYSLQTEYFGNVGDKKSSPVLDLGVRIPIFRTWTWSLLVIIRRPCERPF